MTAVTIDAHTAAEIASILEFIVGWLHADHDYARNRLPLYGTYTIDDLIADTERLTKTLGAT